MIPRKRNTAARALDVARKALLTTTSLFLLACPPAFAETQPEMELDGVVVTATRSEKDLKDVPSSVSVVTEKDIRRRPAATVGDLLRDVPGVEVTDQSLAGTKRISIRGESAARVLILIDGQKISEQKSMDGAALLIDTNRIERIEVIKGPASVLYGSEAIGGVVNIITKKGGDKAIQGEASVTYDTSTEGVTSYLSAFGSSHDFNYRVSGTWTDADDRHTPDGTLDNSSFMQRDVSASLSYDKDNLSIGGGYDNFWSNLNAHVGETPEGLTSFELDLPRWEREKVNAFVEVRDLSDYMARLRLDAYHQKTRKVMNNNMAAAMGPVRTNIGISTENKQKTTGVSLQTDWTPFDNHYLIAGAETTLDVLDATTDQSVLVQKPPMMGGNIAMDSATDYDAEMQTTAIYLQDEWKLPADFTLTVGCRQTWVESELKDTNDAGLEEDSTSDSKPVFNAGLVYEGFENLTLRTQFAQGYRTPNLQQLFIGTAHGDTDRTLPNPDLSPEESNSYEIGARYDNGALVFDGTAFFTEAKDYITVDTAGGVQQFANVDKAKSHGVELDASYTFEGLGLTPYAQGTWLKRKYESDAMSTYKTGSPEFSGRAGIRYEHLFAEQGLNFFSDLYARGAVKAKEEASDGEVETHAPWETLNLSLGGEFGDEGQHFVTLNLNNLFDRQYSTAQSNIDEAGFNAVIKVGTSF